MTESNWIVTFRAMELGEGIVLLGRDFCCSKRVWRTGPFPFWIAHSSSSINCWLNISSVLPRLHVCHSSGDVQSILKINLLRVFLGIENIFSALFKSSLLYKFNNHYNRTTLFLGRGITLSTIIQKNDNNLSIVLKTTKESTL